MVTLRWTTAISYKLVDMSRRPAIIATTAATVLLAAGACGGHGSQPSPTYAPYMYGLAIAQCSIDRGLIPEKYWKKDATTGHWLDNGHIKRNSAFVEWWSENDGLMVAGRTLNSWTNLASQQKHVPAQICGNTMMPTPLNTTAG